jgi:hypothetical protein
MSDLRVMRQRQLVASSALDRSLCRHEDRHDVPHVRGRILRLHPTADRRQCR